MYNERMRDSLKDHVLNGSEPRNQFQGTPIISDQITREGLGVVWRELESALRSEVPGHIVEFGCYAGTTSLFIRRLLDRYQQSGEREFHVYDSFEGLPPKTVHDSNAAGVDFEAGKLFVTRREFAQAFRAANLQVPIVHKGWFDQLSEQDVPEPIAFAFLDGDFYDSIIDSLRLVWPRLSERGVILIDDYQRETLPGVARAVEDFFRGKSIKPVRGEYNIARIERA